MSGSRSAARLAAVQGLYQAEMSNEAIRKIIAEFCSHRLGHEIEGVAYAPADVAFFEDLTLGVTEQRDSLDAQITALLSEGWTLDRLDRPLRQILRAGLYELTARPDVPARAAINEYVEVARAFYPGEEPRFVNGLLDRAARTLGRLEPAA